jgi:hypothetical protein
MLASPIDSSAITSLIAHYALDTKTADVANDFVKTIRDAVLSLVAQVYWRMNVWYEDFPFRMSTLSDPRFTPEDRAKVAADLWAREPCCLDPGFSQRVRRRFDSPDDMLADQGFRDAVDMWSSKSKICNMHVERMLALIRQSVPSGRLPNLERLVSAGYLTQVLQQHRAAGGRHPGHTSRQDLIKAGVQIVAAAPRPDRQPTRSRGHLLLMNTRCQEAGKAKGEKLNRVEYHATRRAAMNEWRNDLGDDAHADWHRRARELAEGAAPPDDPQPEPQYDSDSLWGVGNLHSPLDAKMAEEVIKAKLGVEHVGQNGETSNATPNSRNLKSTCRNSFCADSLCF